MLSKFDQYHSWSSHSSFDVQPCQRVNIPKITSQLTQSIRDVREWRGCINSDAQHCVHRMLWPDPEHKFCSEMCSLALVPCFSRLLPSLIVFFLAAKPALCVTEEEFYSFGWSAGDRRLRPSDDGYSQALSLQTPFPFYDENQGVIHVSAANYSCLAGARMVQSLHECMLL